MVEVSHTVFYFFYFILMIPVSSNQTVVSFKSFISIKSMLLHQL